MKALLDLPAFSVGGTQYYWRDVALAAAAWGEWYVLKEDVRRGLACAKRMRYTGESPTDKEMNLAMSRFRYEHGLVTADETGAWLKQWGLNNVDWMKYICMSILRKKWADQLSDIVSDFPVTDQEIDLNIEVEAVCSGQLLSVCHKLAARLSIYERQKKEAAFDGSTVTRGDGLRALLRIFNSNLKRSGRTGFSPDACRKKLYTLAFIDIYFRHFCMQAFKPEAINEQIRFHNFDWIRIDYHYISFPDEQIAREAALCVKEDGEGFRAVAARVKSQILEGHYYLDRLDSSLHTHFLNAQKGELIGPLDLAGKPTLFLICEKVMPSEKDPYIKEKAREKILKNIINYEIQNRIQWQASFIRSNINGKPLFRPV